MKITRTAFKKAMLLLSVPLIIFVVLAMLHVRMPGGRPKFIGLQQVVRLPIDAAGALTNALISLPDDYSTRPDKRYPLLLFLHGAGEGSSNNIEALLHTGPSSLIARGWKPYGIDSATGDTVKYIVVSPHAAGSGWSYQYGHVKVMLPYLEEHYRIDTERVFLSGISAGGYGVWTCMTDDPDFAREKITGIIPISAAELDGDREKSIAKTARYNVAIWAVCGTKDSHFAGAVRYDTLIRNAHPAVPNHLIPVEGAGHDSTAWGPVFLPAYKGFDGKDIWTRLLDYRKIRNAGPAEARAEKVPPVHGATDNSLPAACKGIRRVITPKNGGVYLSGAAFSCQPGDTLVLSAGYNPWQYFALEGLHGTEECPIVVINEGGQVRISAMGATNCTHVKFTGSGTKEKYGFYMTSPTGTGTAIGIDARSAYVEVERCDIYHYTYGAWIKQEASCADSLQYPNWHIHDISFHDNRMFNIGQDCIYAGSTSPNGTRAISCNGALIKPIPLRLANIKIYNNIIDSVNRTGIQLSGADSGFNEIYHNKITRCGFELNAYQGNGISLGGYTHAYVHDNDIRQTFLNGIFCLGAGQVRIENNYIDSSGYLGKVRNNGVASIMVDTRKTSPITPLHFIIRNNALGINTDANIRVYKTEPTYAAGNIICNNTGANIKVEKGIEWTDHCKTP